MRITATPHAIAIGFAAGACASFTPFIGFHFLIAFALAYAVGGNLIASALGTSVGNPLTFPFIWAVTYKVGSYILKGEAPAGSPEIHHQFQEHMVEKSLDVLLPLIKPMLIGAVPLGLITGLFCYIVVYQSVQVYQSRRRRRLEKRRLEQGPDMDLPSGTSAE